MTTPKPTINVPRVDTTEKRYCNFGENIEALRAYLNLTQYEMATFLGVAQSTVRNWEHKSLEIVMPNNRMTLPSYNGAAPMLGHLLAIEQKFGIPIKTMLFTRLDLDFDLPMNAEDYDSLPDYVHYLNTLKQHFRNLRNKNANRRH